MPDLNPDGTVYVPPEPVDLDRARSVAACKLCDADGYTGSRRVCDHVDHARDTEHGRALARAEVDRIRRRKADRARGLA